MMCQGLRQSSGQTPACAVLHRALEVDPESAAASRTRRNPNATAHAFDRFANNSQTNAVSFEVLRRIEPLKHPENPFLAFLRNPNPIVFNGKANKILVPLGANLDLRDNAGCNEFDGI